MKNNRYRPYTKEKGVEISDPLGQPPVLRLPDHVINVDRLDIFMLIRGSNLSTKSMKDPTLYSVNDRVKTDPEKIDKVRDRVLVKILAFKGKHKISDKFEEELYTVIEQTNDNVPVYKVQGLETKSVKTLHRHHLHLVANQDEIIIRINDSAGQKEQVPYEYKENVSVKEKLDGEEGDVTESEDELVHLVFGDAQKKTVITDDQVAVPISDNGHSVNDPNNVIQDDSTFENVEHVEVESEDQDGLNVGESPVLNENVDEEIEPSTKERESVQVNDVSESANEVRERVEEQDGRDIPKPAPRRTDRVKGF
ncbi:hypothetical protein DPMN_093527 [Dreissena polymorpha]|uniref:Uncharacterized protein n=1 Tax=Dreissena polymorpha TaxID=45954 RepID=A0A9D4L483_DREPO|nr:hypothetical protein DPMN_093527 [Dreissena polymorpha]